MKTKVLSLILILVPVFVTAQTKSARDLFYEGIYAEELTGDLKKAIGIYNDLIKQYPSDRQMVAKSTYHLGLTYEKLGDNRAMDYYVKVLEKFPEQADLADLARDRISKLRDANTFIDPRDGHKYKWIKIGNQIWMAENLAYLPHVNPYKKQEYGIWVYDYDGEDVAEAKATRNYQTYGCLYDWTSAMDIDPKYLEGPWEGDSINRQGLCPPGWHLPTDKEFKILEKSIGMPDSLLNASVRWGGRVNTRSGPVEIPPFGRYLKSSEGWLSEGAGDGSSGFNVLGAGIRRGNDYGTNGNFAFSDIGYSAYLWTSTIADSIAVYDNGTENAAWVREFDGRISKFRNIDDIPRYGGEVRSTGLSIRCLKNDPDIGIKPNTQLSPILSRPNIKKEPAGLPCPKVDTLLSAEMGVSTPLVYGNIIMVACKDSFVRGFDLNSMKELWKVKIPVVRTNGFAYAWKQNAIYMSGASVNSIDIKTGHLNWTYPYSYMFMHSCIDSSSLYLVESAFRPPKTKAQVTSLDLKTGLVRWQIETEERTSIVPATDGQLLLYINGMSVDRNQRMDNTEVILYARDCSTGKELWRFKTSASSSLSDPTITGDYCITNGGDSYTYILDKITGAMIRRFFVSSDLVFGDPKVDQGVIFIGAQNQSFYAFDLNTGQEKWRFQCTNPPQGGFGFNESSCFLGEYVITTTMHGVIYCLNKNTGDPLWKYKIAGIQNTNNFPIVHDDKVYLTTGMQGMLLRIDPFDYR